MFTYQIDDELSLALPRPKIDAQPLFDLVNNSRHELAAWLPWVPAMTSVADEEKFLTTVLEHFGTNTSVNLVIRYHDQAAGMISFNSFNTLSHSTEIGYWLGNQFAGKNIMHRAVLAMCDLGFIDYNLNKIEIHAAVNNDRSNHVAKKPVLRLMEQAGPLNYWTMVTTMPTIGQC